MLINTDLWQLKTTDLLQKQELLALAAEFGVPTVHRLRGHHDDGDPFISWFADGGYLGVLPARVGDYRVLKNRLIEVDEFERMCKAYQAEAEAQRVAKQPLVTA
jgi:hypothetical protein